MFNKGQLAGLMKQAQAMQENMKKAQDELGSIEVSADSGAGLVKVTMTCNAAVRKAEETSAEKMGKITAGMPGLPGGMKFPF